MKKIRVMIVDDSALIRQTLTSILNSDHSIEVVATAPDPIIAARKIMTEKPDVLTLDMEMPKMSGLQFLKKLMVQYPIPVVVISSLTENGSELAMKSLEYGAIEVITKPKITTRESLEESKIILCDAVKAAAHAKMKKAVVIKPELKVEPKLSADEVVELFRNTANIKHTTDKIIAVGASTGGTQAIEKFLREMPPDCPGIVIVQHMPELFTRSFAERLNQICSLHVKEGEHGELVTPGKAIIAPGNRHMLLAKTGAKYYVEINDGPLVNRHRPSVDVLFRSVANCAGPNALGIIMTGMGDDGAHGLLEMKNAGAHTIAEDESTCVVFGMPKVAISLNAALQILPLHDIARYTFNHFKA
jgi:two-component system, chemotaxis family, protein-glutamate methylesterase/glutaminase